MRTSFSKIVTAVIASLSVEPAVCKAIYRARSSTIPVQDQEAISVQWEQAVPATGTINGAPIDWTTRLTVECYARSATESGDLAVDALLARVFERLAENATLGGIVSDLTPAGVEVECSSDGTKTGWVRLTYAADHRTENNTLS